MSLPAQALGLPERDHAPELYVRHAQKNGRRLLSLRAVDHGHACLVEAEVAPHDAAATPGSATYTFVDAREASRFVTDAVEALMYLGCEITDR
jgi:hypothetical protein